MVEDTNEFNRVAEIEQKGKQANTLSAIVLTLRDMKREFGEVKKELRKAREELRHIGKLRPLREVIKEEEPGEEVTPEQVV